MTGFYIKQTLEDRTIVAITSAHITPGFLVTQHPFNSAAPDRWEIRDTLEGASEVAVSWGMDPSVITPPPELSPEEARKAMGLEGPVDEPAPS